MYTLIHIYLKIVPSKSGEETLIKNSSPSMIIRESISSSSLDDNLEDIPLLEGNRKTGKKWIHSGNN